MQQSAGGQAVAKISDLRGVRTLEMSGEVVTAVVDRCQPDELEELLRVGERLVEAIEKRRDQIVAQATALIGFSGAILAFLLTQRPTISGEIPRVLLGVGTLGAFASCAAAFTAARVRGAWAEFGEQVWFEGGSAGVGVDALRRFYVKTLHVIHQQNHKIVDRGARNLKLAQMAGAIAAISLAAALAASVLCP